MSSTSHLNHIRLLVSDATDASGGLDKFTPPTGKIFEPKHMIISWTGDANAAMQIFDATSGNAIATQVFDFNYDYGTAASENNTLHIPLDGFYFSKGFRVYATANKVNLMVSGIIW